MSNSDDSEDEEEIRKRLYADFDQVSVNDTMTEKSFILEHKQYDYHDFTKSKTWLEFMNQNKEREEMLDKIDDNIQLMKKINQGNHLIEVEDDNGELLKVEVPEQLENEAITEMKEKPQPDIVCHEEKIVFEDESNQKLEQEIAPQIVLKESQNPEKVVRNSLSAKKPSRFVSSKQKQDQKIQQMGQEREQIQMEIEDNRSKEYQDFYLRQLFKNRLYTLPEEFPALKQISIKPVEFQFTIPVFTTPIIQVPEIMTLEEENLAPNNTKELVFAKLQNIKFLKLQYSEQKVEKQQIIETPLVVGIDTELKYNIVYQDFVKNQSKLTLSKSIDEIYWKKVNNLHQDLMSIIAKLFSKFPKYIPYRQPFTDFEQPKTNIENINFELENENQLSSYVHSNQIPMNARKLEIKLENLTTIKGVEKMREIRQLILSSNSISNLTSLSALLHLIEVDLSQNKITKYDSLGQIPNLRILRLEMNQISEMSKLENCKYLEFYSLKGNQIKEINYLENLIFLKQLFLFKNQLRNIQGLENCLLLEILDLSSNQIEIKINESPFRNSQCLRKLILSKNKITVLPEMRLLLLNELYINKNKLESLDGLVYLPSLQILQVQDNCLQTCYDIEYQISYFPNIQQIDISGNRIQSFGTILHFISRCNELKQINYIENPFLFGLSEDVFQLYRYLLILHCTQLIEVNQSLLNKKDQEFLKEKFTGFLDPIEENRQSIEFKETFQKFRVSLIKNTGIMHRVNGLEQRKLTKNHPFSYTERFKQIQIMNDATYIKSNFMIQLDIEQEIQTFNNNYQLSIYKVQKILYRWIYAFRKRQKYYSSKISHLIKVQAIIRGHLTRNIPEVACFRQKHSKQKISFYVTKIQKVWRGYIIRKRLKERMKGIKFEDNELDELGEVDGGCFDLDLDMNFDLRIPQGIDLQQLFKQTQSQQQLIQQQLQKQAQEKVNQKIQQQQQQNETQFKQAMNRKPTGNTETAMRTSHLSGVHSQLASSKYSDKSNKTDQLPSIGIGERTKVYIAHILENYGKLEFQRSCCCIYDCLQTIKRIKEKKQKKRTYPLRKNREVQIDSQQALKQFLFDLINMGQTPSTHQNISQISFFKTFQSQFKPIDIKGEQVDGQVYVCETNQEMIIEIANRILDSESDEQWHQSQAMAYSISGPNIITYYGSSEKQSKEMCSSYTLITGYYEFVPHNIQKEIFQRKNNQEVFPEKEIWYLLQSLASTLYDLKQKGYNHKDLRPTTIGLKKNGILKLCPVGLLPHQKNSVARFLTENQQTYLPPTLKQQLITGIHHNINWNKIDAYALGHTLLALMLLDVPTLVDQNQIIQCINQCNQRYSLQLVRITEGLMQENDEQILIEEIFLLLKPYSERIINLQDFFINFEDIKLSAIPLNTMSKLRLKYITDGLQTTKQQILFQNDSTYNQRPSSEIVYENQQQQREIEVQTQQILNQFNQKQAQQIKIESQQGISQQQYQLQLKQQPTSQSQQQQLQHQLFEQQVAQQSQQQQLQQQQQVQFEQQFPQQSQQQQLAQLQQIQQTQAQVFPYQQQQQQSEARPFPQIQQSSLKPSQQFYQPTQLNQFRGQELRRSVSLQPQLQQQLQFQPQQQLPQQQPSQQQLPQQQLLQQQLPQQQPSQQLQQPQPQLLQRLLVQSQQIIQQPILQQQQLPPPVPITPNQSSPIDQIKMQQQFAPPPPQLVQILVKPVVQQQPQTIPSIPGMIQQPTIGLPRQVNSVPYSNQQQPIYYVQQPNPATLSPIGTRIPVQLAKTISPVNPDYDREVTVLQYQPSNPNNQNQQQVLKASTPSVQFPQYQPQSGQGSNFDRMRNVIENSDQLLSQHK